MDLNKNVVYIVDDDAAVRDALGLLLSLHGYKTAFFADAAAFLNAWNPQMHGCLLLDIRMPGMDGLELQKLLLQRESELPVIIITGHGDVDSSREAFRSFALDFLEKPLQEEQLVRAIEEAFAKQSKAAAQRAATAEFAQVFALLTPREKEVMEHVVAGSHNREIAEMLGISVRTIEVHKARIMDKVGAKSTADLVRQYVQFQAALQSGAPPDAAPEPRGPLARY